MPDNELRVGVSVDGKSINDLRALARAWEDFTKNTTVGSKSFQTGAAEAVRFKNAVAQASSVLQSENAKLMKSYFSLGQQLRQFYMEQRVGDRTMREIAGTAALFGVNMNGVVQITQQAEFAIHGLGMAAERAGGKLGAAGSQILRFAGPLTALATIAGTEVMLYDEMVNRIVAAQNKMKGIKTPPKGDWWLRLLGQMRGPGIVDVTAAFARTTLASERAAWERENMIQMDEITVTGGRGGGAGVASPFRAPAGGFAPLSGTGYTTRGDYFGTRPMPKVAQGEGIEGSMPQLNMGEQLGLDALKTGMSTVAWESGEIMRQSLLSAFGQATSVFQQLMYSAISNIAAQMTTSLVKNALGGLIGLIPGAGPIMEFLGFSAGSQSTGATNAVGLSAQMSRSANAGGWRIKGTDLVYVTQRASNRLATRAM